MQGGDEEGLGGEVGDGDGGGVVLGHGGDGAEDPLGEEGGAEGGGLGDGALAGVGLRCCHFLGGELVCVDVCGGVSVSVVVSMYSVCVWGSAVVVWR